VTQWLAPIDFSHTISYRLPIVTFALGRTVYMVYGFYAFSVLSVLIGRYNIETMTSVDIAT